MTDPLAKIWSKSYLQAANIKAVMDSVTPGLLDAVDKLGAVVTLLQETLLFGRETRQDVVEAIEETAVSYPRLVARLEQVLASVDVFLRATSESGGLTEETRLQVSAAASHLQEAGDLTAEHLSTASTAATLGSGLEYLMVERERLEKILGLADPKLTAEILKRMGWRVRVPVVEK